MADKVDYSKNIVDFSSIMWKLHEVAMSNAGQQGIRLHNTAFSDDDPPKFNGAGEYAIFLSSDGGQDVPDSDKPKYLKYVQTYVKYFVGEDASKLIKREDLQPMTDLLTSADMSATTSADVSATTSAETSAVSEAALFISRRDRMLSEAVDFIFEADPPPAAPSETGEPEKKDGDGQRGFCIFYAIDVAGQQRRSFADIIKRKTKGFFGGMLADLRNIEIKTLGGGSIKLGKMFDPAKWKDLAGIPDINIHSVDNNIQRIINNDYPQSSAQVRVYDSKSLINLLDQKGKDSPDIRKRLQAVNYAVTIMIEQRGGSYKEFTKEKIADICTRAFGTALNITNFNKVKADDVIQIDDWESEYKTQSAYDIKRNSSSNPASATGVSTKESMAFIFGGSVVESIMRDLFGDEIVVESQNQPVDALFEDEFVKTCKSVLEESDFQDLQLIRKKMEEIGFEPLKNGLDELKKYYIDELDKLRKQLQGGSLPNCKPFTVFSDKQREKFDKNRDSYLNDLFRHKYMALDDGNSLIKYLIGSKERSDTLSTLGSMDEMLKKTDRYFGKDEDYSDVDETRYGSRYIEAYVLLKSLERLARKDDDTSISVKFMYKNPEKGNALPQLLSTYVTTMGEVGNIPVDEIASALPDYEEYEFARWNPDPTEFTKDNTSDKGVEEVTAEFKKPGETTKWTMFIVPHKRLTSQNRPNQEEKFDDGTVRSKSSDEPYKSSDMRM